MFLQGIPQFAYFENRVGFDGFAGYELTMYQYQSIGLD